MIGIRLWQLRQRKNYSLRALAQATGLSHSFICDIEHGRCNPSLKTLQLIAQALGVTPAFFLNNMVDDNERQNGMVFHSVQGDKGGKDRGNTSETNNELAAGY